MIGFLLFCFIVTEIFLASKAFSHENAALVFGVISFSVSVFALVLILKGLSTDDKAWEGLGIISAGMIFYLGSVFNGFAGLITGMIGFGDQHANLKKIKMGQVIVAIVFMFRLV